MSNAAINWVFGNRRNEPGLRGPKNGQRLVLLVLANYANDEGEAYPGIDTIAHEANMGRDTVKDALAALVDKGYIAKSVKTGPPARGSRQPRNVYRLLWDVEQEGVISPPPVDTAEGVESTGQRGWNAGDRGGEMPASSATAPISVNPTVGTQVEPAAALTLDMPAAPTVEQSFEQLWKHYPRHIAKPAALKAYRTARKFDSHDQIMVGLSAWCRYWTAKNEPQFIPHPSTWLNQHRWQDTPPPLVRRPGQTDVHAGLAGMRFDATGTLIDNP